MTKTESFFGQRVPTAWLLEEGVLEMCKGCGDLFLPSELSASGYCLECEFLWREEEAEEERGCENCGSVCGAHALNAEGLCAACAYCKAFGLCPDEAFGLCPREAFGGHFNCERCRPESESEDV